MGIRASLALGIVDINSANNCLEAMSLASAVENESARGLISSNAVACSLLEEASSLLSSSLVGAGDKADPSRVVSASGSAVGSPRWTATGSFIGVFLGFFLALRAGAMAKDSIKDRQAGKFILFPSSR